VERKTGRDAGTRKEKPKLSEDFMGRIPNQIEKPHGEKEGRECKERFKANTLAKSRLYAVP